MLRRFLFLCKVKLRERLTSPSPPSYLARNLLYMGGSRVMERLNAFRRLWRSGNVELWMHLAFPFVRYFKNRLSNFVFCHKVQQQLLKRKNV